MLSEKIIEKLVNRLVNRIEEGNLYVLNKIGDNIKQIGELSPTNSHKLAQILKYGGSYKEIERKLAEITKLNLKDIDDIFKEVAKKDLDFAKDFYKYRNKDFIPYEQNIALKQQVEAIADITKKTYRNLSKTTVFKYDKKLRSIRKTYVDTIDKAVLSVSQGKTTFNDEMFRTIRELASSGIKTTDYGGTIRRLDSAVRMNMMEAITSLHNATQEIIGKQIGFDGWEISVHENPAIDHEDAQGRQFTIKEYNKLQKDGYATNYTGKEVNMHLENKDGIEYDTHRPIGKMNCYHYAFSIILGVNKPQYSDEQLKQINERNEKGFEFDGKHYTMYEGTQLQRKLETAIRYKKDELETLKSGNLDTNLTRQKLTHLTTKYNELCKISKLPRKAERLRIVK